MKKNVVLGLLGTTILAGLGIGAYFLLKDDKDCDIPDLDTEDEDTFFDEDIADDFEKESVTFENDVEKVFDNNVKEVAEHNLDTETNTDNEAKTLIVGEPSDYENPSFVEVCGVSREYAIKVILENKPEYKEEDLINMIGSELAFIYSQVDELLNNDN